MSVSAWMSWEGGVDLVGSTSADAEQPNIVIHVARMVHTPVGSAPSGLVLFAPEGETPLVMGFISTDARVGAYFGPHIFAGTPFEQAPVLPAEIEITSGDNEARARVVLHNYIFESHLSGLGPLHEISRPIGALPFTQNGLEAIAAHAALRVNGRDFEVHVPAVGLSGGPGAVFAAAGTYAR